MGPISLCASLPDLFLGHGLIAGSVPPDLVQVELIFAPALKVNHRERVVGIVGIRNQKRP
jgi:hypothetical protein